MRGRSLKCHKCGNHPKTSYKTAINLQTGKIIQICYMFCEDFKTNGTGMTKDEAKRNAVVNWNKMMKEILYVIFRRTAARVQKRG